MDRYNAEESEGMAMAVEKAIRGIARDEIRTHEKRAHGGARSGRGIVSPLLAAIALIGIAYMMRKRPDSMGEMVGMASDRVQRTAGEKAQRTERMGGEVAERVRESGQETSGRAEQMTEEAADRIEEGGAEAADRMEEGGEKLGDKMEDTAEEE